MRLAGLFTAAVASLSLAQAPTPKAEAPKAPEAPKAEAPKAEAPKAETPKAPDTVTPPATPPAPAAATPQFSLKLEKDKAFFQRLTTTVEQTIKVSGNADLRQKHEQVFYFKWTPIEQVGDKWRVKQTIEGAKMTIDIAGNQVKYDSTAGSEGAGGAQPGLSDFFGKLVGSEFIVTYGKNMTVEKVEGRDEFLKKLGGANNQMEAILKKMLSEEALKQMVDPTFGIAPPTEVKDGGSWDKTVNLSLGPIGSYDMKNKYTWKGKDATQKELERIEVASTVTYKAPTEQGEGLLFKVKGGELKSIDPTPEQAAKNVILYDTKLGRVVSSDLTVKMKGSLNVTIGSTDTTINLEQDQTTKVETADKTYLEKK